MRRLEDEVLAEETERQLTEESEMCLSGQDFHEEETAWEESVAEENTHQRTEAEQGPGAQNSPAETSLLEPTKDVRQV